MGEPMYELPQAPAPEVELKTRVDQFNALELPGQPRSMHMGTSYLVNDLWRELRRMTGWVADLQSGMYVNCVYCGHRYGPQMTTPVTMADALKEHIAQCPEHPMAKCVAMLKAASHALKSYAHGNSAPDLAAMTAEACDLVVAKATGASP
jgi:hypothetical protein